MMISKQLEHHHHLEPQVSNSFQHVWPLMLHLRWPENNVMTLRTSESSMFSSAKEPTKSKSESSETNKLSDKTQMQKGEKEQRGSFTAHNRYFTFLRSPGLCIPCTCNSSTGAALPPCYTFNSEGVQSKHWLQATYKIKLVKF